MSDGKNGSFWTSLPGIITATATLVTALAGLSLFQPNQPKSPDALRANSSSASSPSNGECTIKGNVSSDGDKIYHMPGDRDYERTKINKTGEKMFCSAADAESEGWNRAPN